MSAEKALLDRNGLPFDEEIPYPSATPSRQKQSFRKKLPVFIGLTILLFLVNGYKPFGITFDAISSSDASPEIAGYMSGIAGKGMKKALGKGYGHGFKEHDEKHKHNHHDHGHEDKHHGHKDKHHGHDHKDKDHGHGHSRHGKLPITPKDAERIFLGVPNNVSARA
jgi:hypothetical protein